MQIPLIPNYFCSLNFKCKEDNIILHVNVVFAIQMVKKYWLYGKFMQYMVITIGEVFDSILGDNMKYIRV